MENLQLVLAERPNAIEVEKSAGRVRIHIDTIERILAVLASAMGRTAFEILAAGAMPGCAAGCAGAVDVV